MAVETNTTHEEAHEMLTTKIRTTFIALVAASSFAAVTGPLAPVASASKNTGAFSKSSEAHKQKLMGGCAKAKITFENWVNMAENDAEAGNQKDFEHDIDGAQATHEVAKREGCSWAARVTPSQNPVTIAPPRLTALY